MCGNDPYTKKGVELTKNKKQTLKSLTCRVYLLYSLELSMKGAENKNNSFEPQLSKTRIQSNIEKKKCLTKKIN